MKKESIKMDVMDAIGHIHAGTKIRESSGAIDVVARAYCRGMAMMAQTLNLFKPSGMRSIIASAAKVMIKHGPSRPAQE